MVVIIHELRDAGCLFSPQLTNLHVCRQARTNTRSRPKALILMHRTAVIGASCTEIKHCILIGPADLGVKVTAPV